MKGSSVLRVAILGATSYIAKSLITYFSSDDKFKLFLFARSPERVVDFLLSNGCQKIFCSSFDSFYTTEYDVVINCVGIGEPGKLKQVGALIFNITEDFDRLVLGYLEKYPQTLYINISSGAVFGSVYTAPIDEKSIVHFDINNISSKDYYGIAKLHLEAKHRALPQFNIVDLRVFSFFSRFVDITSVFFMSQLVACVYNKTEFVTNRENMVRDYIHPSDLFSLIEKCIEKRQINGSFDVYSTEPIEKLEILKVFREKYGLVYKFNETAEVQSVTGSKNIYYSVNKIAQQIGYTPAFRSIDTLLEETNAFLNMRS